jgi:hypothetical protein
LPKRLWSNLRFRHHRQRQQKTDCGKILIDKKLACSQLFLFAGKPVNANFMLLPFHRLQRFFLFFCQA